MEETHMTLWRVWTGPTLVQHAANLLRKAGLTVNVEGVQHVHVEAETAEQVLSALPTWTHRDVHALRVL
jgi:hypothetical protein